MHSVCRRGVKISFLINPLHIRFVFKTSVQICHETVFLFMQNSVFKTKKVSIDLDKANAAAAEFPNCYVIHPVSSLSECVSFSVWSDWAKFRSLGAIFLSFGRIFLSLGAFFLKQYHPKLPYVIKL
jgi:hypothetical protein